MCVAEDAQHHGIDVLAHGAGEVGDALALAEADLAARKEDAGPPSWAMAAWKLTRVRSDGFSKTRPRTRPGRLALRSPRAVGRFQPGRLVSKMR